MRYVSMVLDDKEAARMDELKARLVRERHRKVSKREMFVYAIDVALDSGRKR